ncbi:PssE/Cps14G family polysaccharide biosynthesis glycosyltransferase [Priestia megaterium]|uniref:PssE/Cps14G family polysaccharide biosynthesis glycosyltransferase n=1 Tax=Priestia megaterium TaxID=1404 RepID=UPI0023DA5DFD|nr:PssE/Cps14G family polysaccharide biosynthesis glycosyltransferase [Priestia megaterium]MDF2013284.1 PssE/Cps14G family polysaccharide biosynthesis glycosyltransferase [Priestia megaterium]
MILVTVGTQNFSFGRLLKMIDELIIEEVIIDPVVGQIGYSLYEPTHYSSFNFNPESEMKELIGKADILITHAGVGTITSALQLQKRVIVVPRLKEYGEHVDNHQLEIAEAYHQKGYIAIAHTKEELSYLLKNIDNINFKQYVPEKSTILSSIEDFISKI